MDHRLPLISANGQAPVAATLEGGKRLDVRRCEDGWCLIDVGDTEGQVREDKLRLHDGGVPRRVYKAVGQVPEDVAFSKCRHSA